MGPLELGQYGGGSAAGPAPWLCSSPAWGPLAAAPGWGARGGARVRERSRGDIQPPQQQQQGWDAAGGGSRQPNKRGLCADLAPRRLSICARSLNRQRPAGEPAAPPTPGTNPTPGGTAGARRSPGGHPRPPCPSPRRALPAVPAAGAPRCWQAWEECKQMSALEGSRLLERGSGCPAGSGECSWA